MRTVLYPPTIDFTFLKQRPQHICSQFAKNGYKVIYCNQSQLNKPVEEVEKNLFVYHNFNQVVEEIKKGKLKIDIFYYTWAKMKDLIPIINPKMIIFDNVDIFSEWSSYEHDAIARADILLCTSQHIYNLREKHHSNLHLVRNACDSSFIDKPYEVPEEMKIDEPKFLFCGAIGQWVNTYVIKKIAERYPTFFVGREFPKQCPSNVRNLGMKDHKELTNYYYSADVCLLPFNTKMEVVQAANPIKVYEHMACGKPTLATSWHETDIYSDVVLSGKSLDEYLELVDVAIEKSKDRDFKQKCFEHARQNTWEKRFEQIQNAITNNKGSVKV